MPPQLAHNELDKSVIDHTQISVSSFHSLIMTFSDNIRGVKLASILVLLLSFTLCATAIPFRCRLRPDPGPCYGYFKKYFYNLATDNCHSFIYGGCEGVVPFDDELSCLDVCVKDRCKLAPATGPCKARIPRYFFNQKTKGCEMFIWGGCKGVVPFKTLFHCQRSCH